MIPNSWITHPTLTSQAKRLAAIFKNSTAEAQDKIMEAGFKEADPLVPHVRYMGPTLCGVTLTLGIFMVGASLCKPIYKTMVIQSLVKRSDVAQLQQICYDQEILLENQRVMHRRQFRRWLRRIKLPKNLKQYIGYFGERMINTSDAVRTIAGLIAIHTVVFGMWQIPLLTPWMYKWFTHLPGSTRNVTLLTSCFSHKNIFHFGFNMVSLCAIGQFMHLVLGREQFVAMYLGTGICTNVVIHIVSLAQRQSVALIPRHGADGATLGLLAYTSTLIYNYKFGGTFLPFRSR